MKYTMKLGKKTISYEEEIKLIKKAQAGCLVSRNKIIQENMRWVVATAFKLKKFNPEVSKLDMEDLIPYGVEGMMKAIELFDTNSGHTISTYSTMWIKQRILKNSFEQDLIKVPKKVKVASFKLKNMEEDPDLCNLTDNELKSYLHLSSAMLQSAKNILNVTPSSLSYEVKESGTTIGDTLISDEESPEDKVLREDSNNRLWALLKKCCSDRELKVITMRYVDNKTLEETGTVLGVTRERIRQIEVKALQKVRRQAGTREDYVWS